MRLIFIALGSILYGRFNRVAPNNFLLISPKNHQLVAYVRFSISSYYHPTKWSMWLSPIPREWSNWTCHCWYCWQVQSLRLVFFSKCRILLSFLAIGLCSVIDRRENVWLRFMRNWTWNFIQNFQNLFDLQGQSNVDKIDRCLCRGWEWGFWVFVRGRICWWDDGYYWSDSQLGLAWCFRSRCHRFGSSTSDRKNENRRLSFKTIPFLLKFFSIRDNHLWQYTLFGWNHSHFVSSMWPCQYFTIYTTPLLTIRRYRHRHNRRFLSSPSWKGWPWGVV